MDSVRVYLAEEPYPESPEHAEVGAWVCLNCFDSLLHLPLYEDNKLVDQSIDLDYFVHPLGRTHRCTFMTLLAPPRSKENDTRLAFARAAQQRGRWVTTTLALPETVRQLILDNWARVAAPTDTSEIRRRSERT